MLLAALVLMYITFSGVSAATMSDSLFARGNDYYMQRQYAMAEQCYTQIIEMGYESADLYFNLGNTYYKQDKFAAAILYYEKALLLKPGDEDIRQNLSLANAHVIDKIDAIPEFFVKRWIKGLRGLFSPDQWAIISIVMFVVSLIGFVVFYISNSIGLRKAALFAGITVMILTVISVSLMFSRIDSIRNHDHAIIMMPSVNARSSPDEQSTNVFVLHEGTKVMVTDSVQQWKEIRLANGNTGWLQEESLGEI